MKKTSILVAVGLSTCLHAQTTVTLDLTSGAGQDLYISDYPAWENLNLNPDPDFAAIAWTSDGTPFSGRSMAEFDLSLIPAGATIISATLDLYGNPAPIHSPGHSTLNGSNAATLRRITSDWNESTTTWNTQPSTTVQHQVQLVPSTGTDQDYTGLNVTALVQDMYADPANSHGFMLQLVTEQFYRALNFASGNCTVASMRPRLTVTYSLDTCVTIPLGQGVGQDLYISDYPGWENLNLNPDPDFAAIAWTSDGTPFSGRSMAEFDLSSVPAGATIVSATLDLYGNPAPIHSPGHSTLNGSNAATLRRITSGWNESTTTWNTQPSTTVQHQVQLVPSTGTEQDYTGLNVTALVQDMYADPANSHGFMLQLVTEQFYRALNFASGNCTDASKRPSLEVCYSLDIGIADQKNEGPAFLLAPNPTSDRVIIDRGQGARGNVSLEIIDALGRTRLTRANIATRELVDVSSFAKGPYLVRLIGKGTATTRRLLVQ